jgi:hypothetical protein
MQRVSAMPTHTAHTDSGTAPPIDHAAHANCCGQHTVSQRYRAARAQAVAIRTAVLCDFAPLHNP